MPQLKPQSKVGSTAWSQTHLRENLAGVPAYVIALRGGTMGCEPLNATVTPRQSLHATYTGAPEQRPDLCQESKPTWEDVGSLAGARPELAPVWQLHGGAVGAGVLVRKDAAPIGPLVGVLGGYLCAGLGQGHDDRALIVLGHLCADLHKRCVAE